MSELYNQYNNTNVSRKRFNGDAIVARMHEVFDVDVNNMFTTPTSVVINMDGRVTNISAAVKLIDSEFMVKGKCTNNTLVFRAIGHNC